MKTPPHKMNVQDLVQWIVEFDFGYWTVIYFEENSTNREYIKELFEEEVYDLIDDEVRYGYMYEDYILHEKGPFDD